MSLATGLGAAPPAGPVVGQADSMINLESVLDVDRSQVLNADSTTSLRSILTGSGGLLRSDADTDPELLLTLQFRESVKIRSIRLRASDPGAGGEEASPPASVKLFLQRPHYGFSECASEVPTDTLAVSAEAAQSGSDLSVKFVKFQNVSSLTLFFPANQKDTPVTFINKLEFIGSVNSGTNMAELKKMDEHSH